MSPTACKIQEETTPSTAEIRQNAGVKIGVDHMREFGFTGAIMSKRKQANHGAAYRVLCWPAHSRSRGAACGHAPGRRGRCARRCVRSAD
jgi:hypothetical protein